MITPDVVVGVGMAAAAAGTWFGFNAGVRWARRQPRRQSPGAVPLGGHEHGVPFDLAGCDLCWAEWQDLSSRRTGR